MNKYIERKNTHKKMMLDLLNQNIKAVDLMAANMLNPDDYVCFEKLMKKLVKLYK
jgi:hypothetical protein